MKVAAVTDSRAGAVELAFDPCFDIPASIAEVASDSKSWWPLAAVPPCVEGGDGNPEVFGEVLGAEQLIELFHLHIVARVDVNWVTSSCQGCCQRVFGGSSPIVSALVSDSDSYL